MSFRTEEVDTAAAGTSTARAQVSATRWRTEAASDSDSVHHPPLPHHEERPQPHDFLPGWQDVYSAALLLLQADNCPLEALQPAGLSSLPPAQAGRQQPARWWASRSSWAHPESSRPWKYAASKFSVPAGLHGLHGATTADPWTDVSPAAAATWTPKHLWAPAAAPGASPL